MGGITRSIIDEYENCVHDRVRKCTVAHTSSRESHHIHTQSKRRLCAPPYMVMVVSVAPSSAPVYHLIPAKCVQFRIRIFVLTFGWPTNARRPFAGTSPTAVPSMSMNLDRIDRRPLSSLREFRQIDFRMRPAWQTARRIANKRDE